MSRFHKIQQRTNVFTMLIMVAGLYIAFRYTSFKHHVGWSMASKSARTATWQTAEAPFVGWIGLGTPELDTLTVSVQPEAHGCKATLWDIARMRAAGRAPLRVIITIEPLVMSQTGARGRSSTLFYKTLSPYDVKHGADQLVMRLPDQQHLALMICTDGAYTNSCLDKRASAATAGEAPERDELYYFQYLIRDPLQHRIGVVDLPKQEREGFATLRHFMAALDANAGALSEPAIATSAAMALVANYPRPFIAEGKLILSLPVRSDDDCQAESGDESPLR